MVTSAITQPVRDAFVSCYAIIPCNVINMASRSQMSYYGRSTTRLLLGTLRANYTSRNTDLAPTDRNLEKYATRYTRHYVIFAKGSFTNAIFKFKRRI
eukprot:1919118-Pleurochrysis_carterae.AAC.1